MALTIVGGGLAGSEAAWQAAQRGIDVVLFEMRPQKTTGAHRTDRLGELICSNSLGSNLPDRASGLLKHELRRLGSLLISCADASSLPAGGALAVDRDKFSECIEEKITSHPRIRLIREEMVRLPDPPAIIATGPLTSPDFSKAIRTYTGEGHLYFYDAIAPIIEADSINMDIAYRANRYNHGTTGEGDYLNCPFDETRYYAFRQALLEAKKIPLKSFETDIYSGVDAGDAHYFRGCQPIEVIAEQGEKSLAFGPMRPVGLTDPKTGRWPFAVVQLRQDNLMGNLYNLVGFQTNLLFSEQQRIFRMIPGLENAKFERYGQMHRNSFIASPNLIDESLAFKKDPGLFIAGQIAGIEGYAGNIASGLLAGINAARFIHGQMPMVLPVTTMTGAIIHYITHSSMKDFQPMKAIFGLLPKLEGPERHTKRERYKLYAERAMNDLDEYLNEPLRLTNDVT